MRVNPCDFGLDIGFLHMTPKAQAMKEKHRYVGLYQNRNICVSEDTIKNQES